jgi:tetratricopeptide (TPR) repeat protein
MSIKKYLFVLCFFVSNGLFSQENKQSFREITGIVTYQNSPLQGVNVFTENAARGTQTNTKGAYTIKAKPGEVITYSYVGFKPLKILVEDVTRVLNIEMILQSENLDEVVVQAKKDENRSDRKDSYGISNKITDATSNTYIKGEELGDGYSNIVEALQAQGIPGLQFYIDPANPNNNRIKSAREMSINNSQDFLWDVDGMTYTSPPIFLATAAIKEIRVLKSLSETNRYGSQGAGGVIVITTHNAQEVEKIKRKKIAQKYYNNEFYNNDALPLTNLMSYNPSLEDKLKNFTNKQEAFNYVISNINENKFNVHDAIEAGLFFKNIQKDIPAMLTILDLAAEKFNTNPEWLKLIGYYYQELGEKRRAVAIYEKILRLRPTYLQSYRDLANAYKENEQYKKAWRIFLSYLNQGKDIQDEEIAKLIASEMEWLYFLRKNQADIKTQFASKSQSIKEFQNDIRFVVEWNTSDADFIIEFVGPDKRAFNFKHTLQENQEIIFNEKKAGYSSREFVISDLKEVPWLINMNYLGNKKPEPTYFKFTLYKNWGKPNQSQEVLVQRFFKERDKYQLFTISKL